jgi:hypothetical protein
LLLGLALAASIASSICLFPRFEQPGTALLEAVATTVERTLAPVSIDTPNGLLRLID